MSYRVDRTMTKDADIDWQMMPFSVNSNVVSTFTVDARDSLVNPISESLITEKLLSDTRSRRTPRNKFTWDRTWIDDNTVIIHSYCDTLEDLMGHYYDMNEFNPTPESHLPLSLYTTVWTAYDPDGNEIGLPLINLFTK